MIFEKIITPGLSHYSYFLADQSQAVVIDPRTDWGIYAEMAEKNKSRIIYILETHCHEDFLVGSTALSQYTGAEIWHADSQLDYSYGYPVSDKQTWIIGKLKLESIHTPGHTPGMMSYLLYDDHGAPWCIFTGDLLFSGEVGRVDLMGDDKVTEMASELYDSIFSKLLLLGDQVIVLPAHGVGSICGSSISNRPLTTIGLERLHNPRLQIVNKTSFIKAIANILEKPPYFNKMETINCNGQVPELKKPIPFTSEEFFESSKDSLILDTRDIFAFANSHIPNSISIWENGLSRYAGWFLPYDLSLYLVCYGNQLLPVTTALYRIGYSVYGYLSEDFVEWHKADLPINSISTITVQKLSTLIQSEKSVFILDVRSLEELDSDGRIEIAHNIPISQLPSQIDSIPIDRPVYILCGSGRRSMIAASLLLQQGPYKPVVVFGGLAAWKSLNHSV